MGMGNIDQVLILFEELDRGGVEILSGIYCIVLNACSQTGKLDEALGIFDEIKNNQKGNLGATHPHIITAMIDCFGRSNKSQAAEELYDSFDKESDGIFYKFKIKMLLSIYSSCVHNNDKAIGKRMVHTIETMQNEHNCNDVSIHNLLSRLN